MRHQVLVPVDKDLCDACATRNRAIEAVVLGYMVEIGKGGKQDLCQPCVDVYLALKAVLENGIPKLDDHLVAPLIQFPLVLSANGEFKQVEPAATPVPAPTPKSVVISPRKGSAEAKVEEPPPAVVTPEPVPKPEPILEPEPEPVIPAGPIERILCSCAQEVEVNLRAMSDHARACQKKKVNAIKWSAFFDGEWTALGSRISEIPEKEVPKQSRHTPVKEEPEAAAGNFGKPRGKEPWREDPFAAQCPDPGCNGLRLVAAALAGHAIRKHKTSEDAIEWIPLHTEENRAMWICGEPKCGDQVPHMLKAAHANGAHNGKVAGVIKWRAVKAESPLETPVDEMRTYQEVYQGVRLRCGLPECVNSTARPLASSRSQHAISHGRKAGDITWYIGETDEVFVGAEAYLASRLAEDGIEDTRSILMRDRNWLGKAKVRCLVKGCEQPDIPYKGMLAHAKEAHGVHTRVGLNFAIGDHWNRQEECSTCGCCFPTRSELLLHEDYYAPGRGRRHAPDSVLLVLPADRFNAHGILKELVAH